jgi:hypothetical protein
MGELLGADGRAGVRDAWWEPRSSGQTGYWLSVTVLFALIGGLGAAGSSAVKGVLPAPPTPAVLVTRTAAGPAAGSTLAAEARPSSGEAGDERPPGRHRVRLKQTVLVHTAPGPDVPRAAISLLGAGVVAAQLDRQGDWVLIEHGRLTGWTRADTIEELE